ncbi:MAG: LPS export ABC transporter periplasmic protein LptC [Candidatus Kapaibacterium sp.]
MRSLAHPLSSVRACVMLAWLGLLLIALLFPACSDQEKAAQTVDMSTIEVEASNTVWNTDITFTDSMFTKARVHADRARLYAARQETILDSQVVAWFYGADGARLAELRCIRARVDNRTNSMYATGDVTIVSDVNGTRVEGVSMMWDNKTRKLSSRDYVKVVRTAEVIEGGVGFESDESMTNYRIFKVKGVKQ